MWLDKIYEGISNNHDIIVIIAKRKNLRANVSKSNTPQGGISAFAVILST